MAAGGRDFCFCLSVRTTGLDLFRVYGGAACKEGVEECTGGICGPSVYLGEYSVCVECMEVCIDEYLDGLSVPSDGFIDVPSDGFIDECFDE